MEATCFAFDYWIVTTFKFCKALFTVSLSPLLFNEGRGILRVQRSCPLLGWGPFRVIVIMSVEHTALGVPRPGCGFDCLRGPALGLTSTVERGALTPYALSSGSQIALHQLDMPPLFLPHEDFSFGLRLLFTGKLLPRYE